MGSHRMRVQKGAIRTTVSSKRAEFNVHSLHTR
jgi:hypothetical protein